jgi:hypothetical protein
MTRQLIAVVTDTLAGSESVEAIKQQGNGDGLRVRLIAPAVEANVFRHTMGDIDEPKREAEQRLEASLAELRRNGIEASGDIGDPDPVQAVQDALLEGPADEVVIFEHAAGQARWFEDGLFEKAKQELKPPLRMFVIEAESDADADAHVVDVETAPAGTQDPADEEVGSAYIPGFSRQDFAGWTVGIVGTVLVIVLAAAVASGGGPETGWKAVAIGVAIFMALINMAHVVGITLFESVHYRGGFARFFRILSLVGTPAAVLVNLLILLLT